MRSNHYSRIQVISQLKLQGGLILMNNLNVKFNSMEHSQKELNKQLNKLEAEGKILYYILQNLNQKGEIKI